MKLLVPFLFLFSLNGFAEPIPKHYLCGGSEQFAFRNPDDSRGGKISLSNNLDPDFHLPPGSTICGSPTIKKGAKISDSVLIGGNARILDGAEISERGKVVGNAEVGGDSKFVTKVSGDALVGDNAVISGDSRIYGKANVKGNTSVSGRSQVYGDAQVSGNINVSGSSQIYGQAVIEGNANITGNSRIYNRVVITGNSKIHNSVICDEKTFKDIVIENSVEHCFEENKKVLPPK